MKRIYQVMLGCLLVALLLTANPAQATSSQTKSVGSVSKEKIVFLYALEGQSGTLKAGSDGTFTLTINDVSPYIVYFSDRPAMIAGSTPLEKFIKDFRWDEKKPASTAVVLRTGDEKADTLIVQISKPEYSAAKKSLSCTVKPFKNYDGTQLKFYVERGDPSLPQAFDGGVELYIE